MYWVDNKVRIILFNIQTFRSGVYLDKISEGEVGRSHLGVDGPEVFLGPRLRLFEYATERVSYVRFVELNSFEKL